MPLRDRDTADTLQRLQAATWGGSIGFLLGMFVGMALNDKFGWPLLPSMIGAAAVIGVWIYAIIRFTTLGGGRAARAIYNPSGSSTPYAHDYSQAQSMVAQGDYRNAATLYRDYINANPTDGEASLRLARLLRDHLGRYDEAVGRLEVAVQLLPQDPVINDHLGDAYWRVGRKHEARFQWERALHLEPEEEGMIGKIEEKLSSGLGKPEKAQPKD